jgi:electron transport complex protein RnfE
MDKENEAFLPNPILGSLIGLCPVIVVTGNFASGSIVALGILLSTLALGALMPALRSLFAERLRAPMAFGLAGVFAALYSIGVEAYSPLLFSITGVFLPLIAVNCIVLATLRRGIRNEGSLAPWMMKSAFLYFVTMIAISAFREIVGAGRLTLPLPGELAQSILLFGSPPLRLLTAPAGGFILLGCLAALYRVVQRSLRRKRIP